LTKGSPQQRGDSALRLASLQKSPLPDERDSYASEDDR